MLWQCTILLLDVACTVASYCRGRLQQSGRFVKQIRLIVEARKSAIKASSAGAQAAAQEPHGTTATLQTTYTLLCVCASTTAILALKLCKLPTLNVHTYVPRKLGASRGYAGWWSRNTAEQLIDVILGGSSLLWLT